MNTVSRTSLLLATVAAVGITVAADLSRGAWSAMARQPGAAISKVGKVTFLNLDIERQVYWLGNLFFWSLVIYGCIRLVSDVSAKRISTSKQDRLHLPWLAGITLSVFFVFIVAAQLSASVFMHKILTPVESLFRPYGISEADPVLFVAILFWSLLAYSGVMLIDSLARARTK